MGMGPRIGDGLTEFIFNEPGAVFIAGGEAVLDYLEAGGEEDGEGSEDSGCTLVEPAFEDTLIRIDRVSVWCIMCCICMVYV